ncbi:SRPBCC family protein [Mycolicibacterium hippocampi]|nr:SRPBCC family protein [Mycolicibacterium hippocampi]
MASIHTEFLIDVDAARAWRVVGDWAAGPAAMAPGYVVSSQAEGDVRVVTFANGTIARERLVARDDAARRIVYSVIGDSLRPDHDNAVMQVIPDGADRCRLVWSRDVLPDELADPLREAMHEAGAVITRTVGLC